MTPFFFLTAHLENTYSSFWVDNINPNTETHTLPFFPFEGWMGVQRRGGPKRTNCLRALQGLELPTYSFILLKVSGQTRLVQSRDGNELNHEPKKNNHERGQFIGL